MDGLRSALKFLRQIDLIVRTKVQYMRAFGGVFGFVHNVAAALMEADAVRTAETVFKAVFCHVVAIAPATTEAMRKVVGGTAARYLPAVPVGFPSVS